MADSNVRITVSADTSGAVSALKRVSDSMSNLQKSSAMDKLSEKFTNVGEKMKSFGETASKYVSLPLIGAGVASVKLASDMSENINKIQVVFGKNAQAVQKWSETTLKSFGIANVTALDMVSKFGDMATSMGLTGDQAVNMSEKMVGLSGDLASFKNIGVKQASEALTGIFTGETESLKTLGIVMLDSNVKALALKNGFTGNWESADQATKVMYRYQYVLNACKNSQGDFGNTFTSAANQFRLFGQSLIQLGVDFGNYLLPTVNAVMIKINDFVQVISKLSPEQKKLIVDFGIFLAVIFPLITAVGNLCLAVGAIIPVVTAVVGVISFASVGIGLAIVAIIAGLAMLAVYTVNHWSEIKNAWTSKTNEIHNGLVSWSNNVKNTFSSWYSAVASKFSQAGQAGYQTVNSIKSAFSSVYSAISTPFSSAWNSVSGIINNIRNACSNIWSGFHSFHIPLPHFNISGSFSIVPPRMPSIGVSWYANGGIVDSPTAGVFGEAGKEALVPMYSSKAMTDVGNAVAKSMPDNVEGNGTGNIVFNSGAIVINALTKEEDPTRLAKRCIDAIDEQLYKKEGRYRRGQGRNIDVEVRMKSRI